MRLQALLFIFLARCTCGPMPDLTDAGTDGGDADAGFVCRGPTGGPDGGIYRYSGHGAAGDFVIDQFCAVCFDGIPLIDGGRIEIGSGEVTGACGATVAIEPCRLHCCTCPDGGAQFLARGCVGGTCRDEATTCAEAISFSREFSFTLCP
jgi:hypothetical protein